MEVPDHDGRIAKTLTTKRDLKHLALDILEGIRKA